MHRASSCGFTLKSLRRLQGTPNAEKPSVCGLSYHWSEGRQALMDDPYDTSTHWQTFGSRGFQGCGNCAVTSQTYAA